MELFHVIEDAYAIVRRAGVYRQSKVFRRGDLLFAGYGAGYVKLLPCGGTTAPNINWLDVYLPHPMRFTERGGEVAIIGKVARAA